MNENPTAYAPTPRTLIRETSQGYAVNDGTYDSLTKAIEAAGPLYTFIPYRRTDFTPAL